MKLERLFMDQFRDHITSKLQGRYTTANKKLRKKKVRKLKKKEEQQEQERQRQLEEEK